jgi:hypothetical protein
MNHNEPQSLYIIEGKLAQIAVVEAVFNYKGELIDAGYRGTNDKAIWKHPDFSSFMGNFNVIVRNRRGFSPKEELEIENYLKVRE